MHIRRGDDPSLSRIGAFSDGVFAFAITLLVLTHRIPHPTDTMPLAGLWTLLIQQWRNCLAFVLSSCLLVLTGQHRVMFSRLPALACLDLDELDLPDGGAWPLCPSQLPSWGLDRKS